jgi:hypothetical protein
MSDAIVKWVAGNDKGASSEAIAVSALGMVPKSPSYPHDGSDFGRCYRLLKVAPEASKGLERLAADGGKVWAALVPRWHEIEAAYLSDKGCYELLCEIIHPIEDASGKVVRLKGGAISFGRI